MCLEYRLLNLWSEPKGTKNCVHILKHKSGNLVFCTLPSFWSWYSVRICEEIKEVEHVDMLNMNSTQNANLLIRLHKKYIGMCLLNELYLPDFSLTLNTCIQNQREKHHYCGAVIMCISLTEQTGKNQQSPAEQHRYRQQLSLFLQVC